MSDIDYRISKIIFKYGNTAAQIRTNLSIIDQIFINLFDRVVSNESHIKSWYRVAKYFFSGSCCNYNSLFERALKWNTKFLWGKNLEQKLDLIEEFSDYEFLLGAIDQVKANILSGLYVEERGLSVFKISRSFSVKYNYSRMSDQAYLSFETYINRCYKTHRDLENNMYISAHINHLAHDLEPILNWFILEVKLKDFPNLYSGIKTILEEYLIEDLTEIIYKYY